jgi:hypothetical protein
MINKTIRITRLIAAAGRGNHRLSFELVNDDGTTTPVVYSSRGNGDDEDSLVVDQGIFSLAQSIYYTASSPDARVAQAQLYVKSQCCCCAKVHVEGINTLSVPATPPPKPVTPPSQ